MTVHVLVYVGLLVLGSQLGGRVAVWLKAPRIIGYMVAGFILGPAATGVISRTMVDGPLELVLELTLAAIAFTIGGELHADRVRRFGKTILYTVLFQAFGAAVLVFGVLVGLFLLVEPVSGVPFRSGALPVALILAAVSTATAPAAVIAIIEEYRARGSLTTVMLGIVAVDDVIAIVLFGVTLAVVSSLANGNGISVSNALNTLGLLGIEIVVGIVLGVLMIGVLKLMEDRQAVLAVALGFILLTAGVGTTFGLSPLLACMVMGFTAVNISRVGEKGLHAIEATEAVMFGAFFALAGCHMEPSALLIAGPIAIVLTLTRFAGKWGGAWLGARLAGAPPMIRRNLGLTLLPQAGLMIGLILEAREYVPEPLAKVMIAAALGSVLINELVTPFAVRHALRSAGEIREELPHDDTAPDITDRDSF